MLSVQIWVQAQSTSSEYYLGCRRFPRSQLGRLQSSPVVPDNRREPWSPSPPSFSRTLLLESQLLHPLGSGASKCGLFLVTFVPE